MPHHKFNVLLHPSIVHSHTFLVIFSFPLPCGLLIEKLVPYLERQSSSPHCAATELQIMRTCLSIPVFLMTLLSLEYAEDKGALPTNMSRPVSPILEAISLFFQSPQRWCAFIRMQWCALFPRQRWKENGLFEEKQQQQQGQR